MHLESMQQLFLTSLRQPDVTCDKLNDCVVGSNVDQIAQRLGVYQNAYRVRLIDGLRDTFGHTAMYLGDDMFNEAACGYIAAHPSTHGNLRWFGKQFAPWLKQVCYGDPEIGELALLDYTLRYAFDGEDAAPLTMESLALIPSEAWATIIFTLAPTAKCLQFQMNTLAIWHALDCDEEPPFAVALSEPSDVLVWRCSLQPHFRSIGKLEAHALGHLDAGLTFESLCSRLGEQFPEAAISIEAGALLRRWLEEELLV